MVEASVAPLASAQAARPARPWTQSLIAAAPVAPAWVGVGLALAHTAAVLLLVSVFGDFGQGSDRLALLWQDWGTGTLVFGLLIGYAPAAMAYSQRGQLRALRELRPVLGVSGAEFEALERELLRFDMRWLRAAGAIQALVTVAILLFDPGIPRTRRDGDPVVLLNFWQNLAAGWLCVRTLVHELGASRLFSRIGERHAEVTLFDLRPLAPFARRGLQGALVSILMISIFSLILLSRGAAQVAPLLQALVVALAGIALFLPVRGVHRRIAQRKREQLDRICDEIRAAEAALFTPAREAAGDAAARLSTLVTLRHQVETAREWPFDVSVLLRFGVVVAIGLLSSLGQVLLERIVGPFLR